jgi:hypothetical protein
MKKMIKNFSYTYGQYHAFFVKESPSLVGNVTNNGDYKLSTRQKISYPLIYVHFMYMSMVDWAYCYKF